MKTPLTIKLTELRRIELTEGDGPMRIHVPGCVFDLVSGTPESFRSAKAVMIPTILEGLTVRVTGPQKMLSAAAVIFMAANTGKDFDGVLADLEIHGVEIDRDSQIMVTLRESLWPIL